MAEILGSEIPISMPSWSFNFSMTTWILAGLIILIIIAGAVGVYLFHRFKTYKYKIVVFENYDRNGYKPLFKDRARSVKLGDGGEEILYLLNKKVYRSAYGKKMGKNTYWFAIGQDGYWYNFVMGDLDAKKGMLDIEPIDRDLRYMHVAVRKNIQDRYKKKSFMEQYGTYIMSGIFLIILLIGFGYIINKIGDISQSVAGSVQASQKVVEATERLVGAINNMQTGGSGLVDAGSG